MKNLVIQIIKILTSSILLIYLFYFSGFVHVQEVIHILKETKLWIFFLVFLIYLINVFVTTKRWSIFLLMPFRYSRLVSLSLIGYFFNTFLPGRLGGDMVKTYYIYRDTGKSIISISSVFLDRYMGFCAMIIITVISFIAGYPYFRNTGIGIVIAGAVILFSSASFILWNLNWGKIKWVGSFYPHIAAYRKKKGVILVGFFYSLIVQIVSIAGVYLLSVAIGLTVPIIYFFIFVPIINAVSTIPFTVAGLGVREISFATLFNIFFAELGVSSDQAISISLLYFTSMLMVNLIGGIEYIRIRKLQK